ncbi:MAG: glycosyltransferase family 2 protein [Chloroflexota bacterium]|nr:glycosyltransferase family 2 protein [Chloroflexota bacterium]
MSELPFASVIIPNYNGRELLATCLEALRQQSFPPEGFEVIVVDDASSDDSVEFLAERFPEVQVVALTQNSGFVSACNAGVAEARGDVLVLLNNDTEVEPGWLEALVGALMAHPEAGSASSKMLLFDRRDVLHTTGDLMGADGIARNRGVWEKDEGQYDEDIWVFGANGGGAAYRREAWEEAGGFDEGLFMYLEDVDLAWRLQLLGWKCLFVPEARVYHMVSATGGGSLASYYVGRNTIWVIARNWPAALLRKHWRAITGAQLRIAWEALGAWRGVAARARLRGQWDGLRGLARARAQRKVVQGNVGVPAARLEKLLV